MNGVLPPLDGPPRKVGIVQCVEKTAGSVRLLPRDPLSCACHLLAQVVYSA